MCTSRLLEVEIGKNYTWHYSSTASKVRQRHEYSNNTHFCLWTTSYSRCSPAQISLKIWSLTLIKTAKVCEEEDQIFLVNIPSELLINYSFCSHDYSGADSLADLFNKCFFECLQSAGAVLVIEHTCQWTKETKFLSL